jgi:tetratricopeptide (TPR) repeat protein
VNATQGRETSETEGVQARGWEIKPWLPVSKLPASTNRQLAVANTKTLEPTRVAPLEYRLGHQAYSLGDVNVAYEHFRVAIQSDPNCVKAHRWLGRVALELGLGFEAKGSYEMLIRLQGYTVALGECLEYADEVSRFGLEAASQFRAGCVAQKNGQLKLASVAFGRAVASFN